MTDRRILFPLFFAICSAAYSQTTFGTITGTATDASGSAMAGVKVSVRNIGTNITQDTATDSRGEYSVSHLNPGAYTVSARQEGFRGFSKTGVLLATGETVRADIPLTVGDVASEVTVTGGAALVETESSNVAAIRTNEVMERLPTNVRGNFNGFFYTMLQLTPGAQQGNGSAWSLGGGRGSQTQFTLDGTSTNSPLFGNAIGIAQTSMESTQELRIDMANNKAEYNLPGMITGTSKSGQNDVHGSAFYYHDNGAFDARNTFARSVPFHIGHDAGFSVGGPVFIPKVYNGRNKTFFFFTFETFPLRSERVAAPNVPTVKMRAGDFSALLPKTVIKDPGTGMPYPGNIIPANLIDAVSSKIQNMFYPLPNFGSPDNTVGNWRGSLKGSGFKHQIDTRIDHHFSSANSIFGRFTTIRTGNLVADTDLPTIGPNVQNRRGGALTIADTHIINPGMINEFRYGLVWNNNPFGAPIYGATLVKELGLQGLSPNLPNIHGDPYFNITGITTIGGPNAFGYGIERAHDYIDNLTWIKGPHALKAGIEVQPNLGSSYPVNPNGAFGTYSFTGAFSGSPYADFLLGIPQSSTRLNPAPPADIVNVDWSLFVQDDWKVSRKLTLNVGLRYDRNPPYHEKSGRYFDFDPKTGKVVVPDQNSLKSVDPLFPSNLIPVVTASQAGFPHTLYNTDKTGFGPRFGFAYRPLSTETFVLRGGIGIYVDPNTASLYTFGAGGPYLSSESFTNGIVNGAPLFQFPRAFPAGFGAIGSQSFTPIDSNVRNPKIYQWNMTVEKEILHVGLRVSYIGTGSRHLIWTQNVNQPLPSLTPFNNNLRRFPAIRDVNYLVNGGNSMYHGLNVVAERKILNGLYYQLGWTWAKNLTDVQGEGENGSRPENSYNRAAERGNVAYMPRHRVVGQLLYTLPFGPGRPLLSSIHGVGRAIVGGWTLSSTFTGQTGQWFNPVFSGFDISDTNTIGGRPDRVGSGNLPTGQRSINRWFDASAFRVPGDLTGNGKPTAAVGRFGNSGVNILEGPGLIQLNAGIHKEFVIKERLRTLLQFTATNALNHPNYNFPSTDIASPTTVGRITSAAAARSGEVAIRFEF
ncbi:MAG: carboxypeptidase regulatory-like domain-containing protein [Bryobacteraceae bacterium]